MPTKEKNEVRMVGVLPSQGADPIPVRLSTTPAGAGMIEKNEVRMVGILPAQGADPIPVTGIQGVPSGCIVMWSGAEVDIPDGWVLCDGANDTPDLRDRFVVGVGSSYAVGDTGGSNTMAHTNSIPALNLRADAQVAARSDDGQRVYKSYSGNRMNCKGSATVHGGELYTYTVASDSGEASNTENRPPYYALCYIMKT